MATIYSPRVESVDGGTISVSNFPATQPVSATDLDIRDLTSATDSVQARQTTHDNLNTNANLQVADTDVSGSNPVPVTFTQTAGTPTVSRVAVSTSVATLAAADSTRTQLIIHNESGILFVKLGTGATSTDYTFRLTADATLTIPFQHDAAVTAIKASGSSFAQVTSIA